MDITLGQTAFEAYKRQVGGVTYDGKPIPDWENLTGGDKMRAAWEEAAQEVKAKVLLLELTKKTEG